MISRASSPEADTTSTQVAFGGDEPDLEPALRQPRNSMPTSAPVKPSSAVP